MQGTRFRRTGAGASETVDVAALSDVSCQGQPTLQNWCDLSSKKGRSWAFWALGGNPGAGTAVVRRSSPVRSIPFVCLPSALFWGPPPSVILLRLEFCCISRRQMWKFMSVIVPLRLVCSTLLNLMFVFGNVVVMAATGTPSDGEPNAVSHTPTRCSGTLSFGLKQSGRPSSRVLLQFDLISSGQ